MGPKLKYQHKNDIYRQYKNNGESYDDLLKFQLAQKDVSDCNEYRTVCKEVTVPPI